MKRCKNCQQDKPISDFALLTRSRDGCAAICRTCAHDQYEEYKRQRIARDGSLAQYKVSKQVGCARGRAREYDVPNTLTVIEWREVVVSSDGRCAYCGRLVGVENLTLDHVVPMSKGGSNSIENVTLACLECNLRKANRTHPAPQPVSGVGEREGER